MKRLKRRKNSKRKQNKLLKLMFVPLCTGETLTVLLPPVATCDVSPTGDNVLSSRRSPLPESFLESRLCDGACLCRKGLPEVSFVQNVPNQCPHLLCEGND